MGGMAKRRLVVWACGGLSEALRVLNRDFERMARCKIIYTGAATGYLAETLAHRYRGQLDVFNMRTATQRPLYLKKYGKVAWFKLFCASEYVVITPKSNPARIRSVKDLGRPGVKVAFAPKAATPESKCILEIVEAAGIKDRFLRNVAISTDCPRKFLKAVASGKVHAAIVERRLACLPGIKGRVRVIPIPPQIAFKGKKCKIKSPFVAAYITLAREPDLARRYIRFLLTSDRARRVMEEYGFVHVRSPRMREFRRYLAIAKEALTAEIMRDFLKIG